MDEILKDISQFVNDCLGPLSGSGPLATWVRDFLIQLCATLILFIVVRVFLWKPITDLLEARRSQMDSELKSAKEHHENAVKLEEELKAKYDDAKNEIAKLLDDAIKEGNSAKEAIINEAKLEAKRRIELANDEINAEIMQKQNDIKDQIVTIAFMAAEKIVGKEIDKNTYLNEVTNIIDSGLKNE
jgi:F-type H+-transporting ATPase subunit b